MTPKPLEREANSDFPQLSSEILPLSRILKLQDKQPATIPPTP